MLLIDRKMCYLKSICLGLLSLISLSVFAGDTEETTSVRSSARVHISGVVTDVIEEYHVANHWVSLVLYNPQDNSVLRKDSVLTNGNGEFRFNYKDQEIDDLLEFNYKVSLNDICSGEPVIFEGGLTAYLEEAFEMEVCGESCEVQLLTTVEDNRVHFSLDFEKDLYFNSIEWSFGDDFYSSDQSEAQHYYNSAGIYKICISYETTYDCYNEICTTIEIEQKTIDNQNIGNVNIGNKNDAQNFEFIHFDNGNSITLIMKEILSNGNSGPDTDSETQEISYAVEIRSLSGQSMYKVKSSNNVLDLPKFNSGLYYIVITNYTDHTLSSIPIVF